MEQKTVTVFCYAPMYSDKKKYIKEKTAMTNYFIRYVTGIYELKKYCDSVDPKSYLNKISSKNGGAIGAGCEFIMDNGCKNKKSVVSTIEEIINDCKDEEDIIKVITENVKFLLFDNCDLSSSLISAKDIQDDKADFESCIGFEHSNYINRQFPLSYIQENADIIVLTNKGNEYAKNYDQESVAIYNTFKNHIPIMMIDII